MSTKSIIMDDKFEKVIKGSEWYRTILIIQDILTHGTFDFFRNKGIYSVHLPITTGSVTSPMGLGSDSLPVKVKLFDVDTYLADSMQFHLEYLLRLSNNKGVHYIMPTFRGEKTDARHLAQFFHSESEIVGDLDDVIELINEYILHLANIILKNCKEDIYKITDDISHIEALANSNGNIPRVKFTDAQDILQYRESCFEYDSVNNFYKITSHGEAELINHFGGPVWITNYPYKSVPFYQKRSENADFAENADLLMGIGETVGCGARCVTKDEVLESMRLLNVDPSEYTWYIRMKEETPIQTAGFGMGMERFILWLLKYDDIRDIQIISRENGKSIEP